MDIPTIDFTNNDFVIDRHRYIKDKERESNNLSMERSVDKSCKNLAKSKKIEYWR